MTGDDCVNADASSARAPVRGGEDALNRVVGWGRWVWGERVGDRNAWRWNGLPLEEASSTMEDARAIESVLGLMVASRTAWQQGVGDTHNADLRSLYVGYAPRERYQFAIELQRLLCRADHVVGTISKRKTKPRNRPVIAAGASDSQGHSLTVAEPSDRNLVRALQGALATTSRAGAASVLGVCLARTATTLGNLPGCARKTHHRRAVSRSIQTRASREQRTHAALLPSKWYT